DRDPLPDLAGREPQDEQPHAVLRSRARRLAEAGGSEGRPGERLEGRCQVIALCAALLSAFATQDATTPREPGLSVYWYFVGEPMDELLPLVPGQTPNVARRVDTIDM